MTQTPAFTAARPLRTTLEYDSAVAEIDRLLDIDPAPGSADADRLELLGMLVEAYDERHYSSRRRSTPQSIVAFVLEQRGRTRADLVPILGSKSRVSEFLSGKRRLSLAQIAALRKELGIPADLLIESDVDVPHSAARTAQRASRVREPEPAYGTEPRDDVERLVAAQREFMERLNKLLDEATRSMGKRW